MVVTFLPATAESGMEQERTGSPSRCTVQAPHWAIPQPNLVPVRWSESRSTHRRGVPGAAATSRVLPLTTRETMKNLLGGRLNELAGRFLILFRPPGEVHTETPRTQDPRMHYLAHIPGAVGATAPFLPNPG